MSTPIVSAASHSHTFDFFLDKENNESKWQDNKWCWSHVVPQVSNMHIHIMLVGEKIYN